MQKIYDLYKKGIDKTLLIANLKRTPEERLLQLMELQVFAQELRKAKKVYLKTKKL